MNILIIIIILAGIILAFVYNRLVKFQVRTEEAWADIDVQLKRRYDLIPNLLETVKGYAQHERVTLQEVIDARSKASSMSVDISSASVEQMQALAGAESSLNGALNKLFALSENYPDLKANENFLELQRELSDTENKIQAARRFFNATVKDLKTALQTFPTNMIASLFGFKDRNFFELPENSVEREVVKVSF